MMETRKFMRAKRDVTENNYVEYNSCTFIGITKVVKIKRYVVFI